MNNKDDQDKLEINVCQNVNSYKRILLQEPYEMNLTWKGTNIWENSIISFALKSENLAGMYEADSGSAIECQKHDRAFVVLNMKSSSIYVVSKCLYSLNVCNKLGIWISCSLLALTALFIKVTYFFEV